MSAKTATTDAEYDDSLIPPGYQPTVGGTDFAQIWPARARTRVGWTSPTSTARISDIHELPSSRGESPAPAVTDPVSAQFAGWYSSMQTAFFPSGGAGREIVFSSDPGHAHLLGRFDYPIHTLRHLSVPTPLEVDDGRLVNASTNDDIIDVLRSHGLDTVADQVAVLFRRHEADPDEPQPNTESLRRMAEAMLGNSRLRSPSRMGLSEEGFLHTEWNIEQGEIAMTFRPSAHIRFAALYPADDSGYDLRVGGLLSSADAMNAVRWLVSRIPAP